MISVIISCLVSYLDTPCVLLYQLLEYGVVSRYTVCIVVPVAGIWCRISIHRVYCCTSCWNMVIILKWTVLILLGPRA